MNLPDYHTAIVANAQQRANEDALPCPNCLMAVTPENLTAHFNAHHNGELLIDPEFEALIPQQAEEEMTGLETSLLAEGCRDALVIWKNHHILIDGHNRYKLCRVHGIAFKVIEREFETRDDVIVWMCLNQMGRRNLSRYARDELALTAKEALARKGKEHMAQGLPETGKPHNTQEQLADMAGTSKGGLSQSEAIKKKAPEKVKEKARKGELSRDRAYKITRALEQSPAEHKDRIFELAGDSDEKIAILNRLYKSQGSPETNGTFEELLRTGGFAYGKDMDKRCDFTTAAIEDIQRALKSVADHHAQLEAEARHEARAAKVIQVAQVTDTYPVIYADPPWQYDHQATPKIRAIENHYETQSLDWICNFDMNGRRIAELATADAVLFMWVTNPKLKDGFAVLEAWGFEYVTNLVWVKDRIGQGYYGRSQHELLLIGKRGTIPVALPSDRPASVIFAPRGEHSAKPHELYEVIERMYPEYRKLELFSRVNRSGWDGWGNDYAA